MSVDTSGPSPSHVFWLKWRLCATACPFALRPASLQIHQAATGLPVSVITSYIVVIAYTRMSRPSYSRASARLGAVAHHLGCSAGAAGAAAAPPPRLLAAAAASAGPSSISSTSAIPSTSSPCSCSINTSSSSHHARPHSPRTMAASTFKQEPHKLLGARERATRRLHGCAGNLCESSSG